MTYIKMDGETKTARGCIFCGKPTQSDDVANLVLYRGRHAFVLMNLFPYNNGHLMVAPYLHTADLAALDDAATLELMQLTKAAQATLTAAFHPQGFNIGMNLGTVAGAGIADHLHMHIVPRWNGDTNFMPVIGETKVMPDTLQGTFEKLKAAWTLVTAGGEGHGDVK